MQTTYSNNSLYNFYNQGGSVTGFNASGVIVESKNTNIFFWIWFSLYSRNRRFGF